MCYHAVHTYMNTYMCVCMDVDQRKSRSQENRDKEKGEKARARAPLGIPPEASPLCQTQRLFRDSGIILVIPIPIYIKRYISLCKYLYKQTKP